MADIEKGPRRFFNKWTKGERHLVRPPLPADMRGITGCRLDWGVFDQDVGPEFFVTIMERSAFSLKLAAVKPFKMFCKTGMAHTDHGMIIFLVFSVFKGDARFASYGMFLGPFDQGTVASLTDMVAQTHIKVLLHDTDSDEVCGFYEFENNFGFDKLVEGIKQVTVGRAGGDFLEAQKEFMGRYSIEEMIEMTKEWRG
jgi:hypothetical protein